MAEITRESVIESMQKAAERMGLDLEDLQEMIIEVLEDCSAKALLLREAIASGDLASIKSIAHDIKGSCANYGLQTASDLALYIEKNNESMISDPVDELIRQFGLFSSFNLDQVD